MRPRFYTGTAKLLHWLVAGLAVALLATGFATKRGSLPAGTGIDPLQLHRSLGMLVLGLMLVRAAWRATHAPPPLPLEMSRLARGLAQANHLLLYGLLVGLPVIGWMMVSVAATPVPTRLPGGLELPLIAPLAAMPADRRSVWEAALKEAHTLNAAILAALVTLHVAAALFHHLWRRDGILRRMLPGRRGMLGTVLVAAIAAALLLHPIGAGSGSA